MRRKKQKKLLAKIAVLSTALVVCAALVIIAALTMPTHTPDKFGCFNNLPQTETIVFTDASEPSWNEEQRRSLLSYFDELYSTLGFNEKLSVYSTEGDIVSDFMPPRFHICGQAKNAAELEAVNAQGGAAGYLQKQRERLYDNVLRPELDSLFSLTPDAARRQAYQSPVLEQVASLSRRLKPGGRLILISDLIQNSDSVKFCRVQNAMPPFADFKKRRIYHSRLKPQSLEGVEAEILMLQRSGYGLSGLGYCRDEEELKDFWRDYFTENGAPDPHFIRIRHGHTGQ